MKLSVSILLVAALSAVCVFPASAQESQSPFQDKPVIGLKQQDTNSRIALARKLIRARDYQGAADVLETAYESSTDNGIIENLLKTCYQQLKQYSKAELLTRRILQRQPQAVGSRLNLAELLAKQGKIEEAIVQYRAVEKQLDSKNASNQLLIIRSMIAAGMEENALAHIDKVRKGIKDPTLFRLERGGLLEARREYVEAAREYIPVLNQDSTRDAGNAERKLLALLSFPESAEQVEDVLMSFADSTAGQRTLRLLADHYVKIDRFDEAFAIALRQDSLSGGTGTPLINVMRRCRERQAWEQVVRVGEHFLEHHDDPRFGIEAAFSRAEALVRLGRSRDAIAAYDKIAATNSHPRILGDALFGIGVVYSEFLHDYRQALVYFDSVVNNFPQGNGYLNARQAIPHCYLRSGQLEEAKTGFVEIANSKAENDQLEETAYFLSLISLFANEFDSAAAGFRKLMVDYPQGMFVNDALRMVLLFDQAGEDKALLGDYAAALFLQQQGLTDSTRAKLGEVIGADNRALADIALFDLVELEMESADTTAALVAIDRLSTEFEDSYYSPLGLKLKADILVGAESGIDQARDIYRQLLEAYPDYPFVSEIRARLRELLATQEVG